METERIAEQVIGGAIEVYRALGPGNSGSVYEESLCRELSLRSLEFKRQLDLPAGNNGVNPDGGSRLDLLVEDRVVVQITAGSEVEPVDETRLRECLKLGGWKVGLLIDFNRPIS